MAVQDDVQALRVALLALENAVRGVARHHGDHVDAHRLMLDVDRVRQDVELLCGHETPPAAPRLQVIDDTAYPQDFWMDAEDEGLGGGR
jgi:hypothetical protein